MDEDEEYWRDVVYFVDVPDLQARVAHLQQDVKSCQTQSYAKFKARHRPIDILNSSGFLPVLRTLLST